MNERSFRVDFRRENEYSFSDSTGDPDAPDASETLDNPRDAILAQARAAFVEKGFDGASMQDLARAAGMSAGNFYSLLPLEGGDRGSVRGRN